MDNLSLGEQMKTKKQELAQEIERLIPLVQEIATIIELNNFSYKNKCGDTTQPLRIVNNVLHIKLPSRDETTLYAKSHLNRWEKSAYKYSIPENIIQEFEFILDVISQLKKSYQKEQDNLKKLTKFHFELKDKISSLIG